MRVLAFLFIVTLTLSSCATREEIMQNYEERVNLSNGVNASEAKAIAQRQIITVEEQRNYKITAPGILNNNYTQKFPDYWFVVFGHNWFSPISTDANAKTYSDLMKARYLIVINKKTGEIRFDGEYFPKRSKEFDWVFQERKPWEDHVKPPPGIPSQEVNP